MAAKKFTAEEWKAIRKALEKNAAKYGLPKREYGSAVLGSLNIRKLGSARSRDQDTWEFLAHVCSHFDLLAVQEVLDDLSGLRRLMSLMPSEYGLIVSDTTGAFPGRRGLAEATMRPRSMTWALLWKEWREQWPVLLLLWALLPAAAFLVAIHYRTRTVWDLFGMTVLSLGAATIGGRLFAPEGEAGTLGFLLRQPAHPASVWGAKLALGAASLAVLYLLWSVWDMVPTPPSPGPSGPVGTALPLVAFSGALMLSALVDNTVLATVGGFAMACPQLLVVGLIVLALHKVMGKTSTIRGGDVSTTLLLAIPLGTTALFIALSWIAFQLRRRS